MGRQAKAGNMGVGGDAVSHLVVVALEEAGKVVEGFVPMYLFWIEMW